MYRIVSLTIVLTLIVVLGITFFKVVAPFLLPLFLAGVVAILAQPLFQHFVKSTRGRVRLASGLATATIFLAILVPITVGISVASMQLYVFATDFATSSNWDETFGTVREGAGSRTNSLAEWAANLVNKIRGTEEEVEDVSEGEVKPAGQEGDATTGEDPPAPSSAGDVPATVPSEAAAAVADGPEAESATDQSSPSQSVSGQLALAEGESVSHPGDLPEAGAEAETETETEDEAAGKEKETAVTVVLPGFEMIQDGDGQVRVTTEEREAVQEISTTLRSGQPVTAEQVKSLVRAKVNAIVMDIGDRSLGIVTGVVFSMISAIVAMLIFTVALYYFFADGTALLEATEQMIPVHIEYQREMLQQFSRVVRAVVSATFLASLGQAIATVLALWFFGFNHLLTLFVLCFLSSLIPMLGTWLVWGPCAVLLALNDQWVAATVLVVYGTAIVGTVDNVIRTYVLNSDTKLHPLLALISVLGGLQVMGLWGVFIGPIVASCLHALVKIFNHELLLLSRSRFGTEAASAAGAMLAPIGDSSIAAEGYRDSASAREEPAGNRGSGTLARTTPVSGTPAQSAVPPAQPTPPGQRGDSRRSRKKRR